MPPKHVALTQALRESFSEDVSFANVSKWASEALGKAESLQQRVHAAREAVAGQSYVLADSTAQTPRAVLSLLQEYQAFARDTYLAAEQVRTVIAVRLPEIKDEDNLGVSVQLTVLKMLDALENKLVGSGGDKEHGAAPPTGMFIAKDYLAARGAIEEKLLGKADDDDDKKKDGGGDKKKESGGGKGTKAPSTLLELQQLDGDVLLKTELSLAQLLTALRAFINVYALNWKTLIQPRVRSERMVV